jgi:tetrapyrrole methylase family protein/MazG family protein
MQSITNQQDEESKIMTGILQVVENVARLRSPTQGCPWFRRQTLQTVRRYLLEEVYEVLEPLDTESPEKLQEELGDLLFQIIVLSQMASERGWFSLDHVLQQLNEKIIRRNPHVFGELQADSVEEVQRIWLARKSLEKSVDGNTTESPLSGLSATMPALALAQAYIGRSGLLKTDWTFPYPSLVFDFESRLVSHPDGMETGLGRMFFMLVDLACRHQLDAEAALQKINAQFRQKVSKRAENLLQDPQR